MGAKKISPKLRHAARQKALQALYQWEIAKNDSEEILRVFLTEESEQEFDRLYFKMVFLGALEKLEESAVLIQRHGARPLAEMDPVELSILRLSCYELLACPELPYKIIVNEGIELAKIFGGTEGHKFVNAVLDKVAQDVRKLEITQKADE